MVLQNNKGSTLIENVLAVFLLSIFCIMAFTTIIARVNTLQSLTAMEESINTAYNQIEENTYSSSTTYDEEDWSVTSGSISFKIEGDSSNATYNIGGTYVADADGIIGEFKS